MYALDNVRIVSRTHFDISDISDIPQYVVDAFRKYEEAKALVDDYDTTTSTPAQKRTATMRFNKFCKICEDAGLYPPNIMFRITNS